MVNVNRYSVFFLHIGMFAAATFIPNSILEITGPLSAYGAPYLPPLTATI